MRTLIQHGRTVAVIAQPITQDDATTICRKLGLPITADLSHDRRTLNLRARAWVSTTDEARAIIAICRATDCPVTWHRWS